VTRGHEKRAAAAMTTTITTKTLTIDDGFVGFGGALGGGTADGSRNVVVDFGAVVDNGSCLSVFWRRWCW